MMVRREQQREYNPTLPTCILRTPTGREEDAEVLTEHGTDQVRVFGNQKAAKRWIKRNVISPAERAKLYFVQAPSVS